MAVLGDRKFRETLAYTWTQHGKGTHPIGPQKIKVPEKVVEELSKGETRRIRIGTGMRRKNKDDISYLLYKNNKSVA
jgi:hypothetical protein